MRLDDDTEYGAGDAPITKQGLALEAIAYVAKLAGARAGTHIRQWRDTNTEHGVVTQADFRGTCVEARVTRGETCSWVIRLFLGEDFVGQMNLDGSKGLARRMSRAMIRAIGTHYGKMEREAKNAAVRKYLRSCGEGFGDDGFCD